MTVTIDFLPFATGAGAGVESQSAWVSDTVVVNGFVTGIAQSTQVNKAVRQPSFVAAAISNFMGGIINQNIQDNGVLNTYWSQFWQSLLNAPSFLDTGTTNALVIAAPGSLTFPAPIAGLAISVKVAATCTGASTLNWMGTGNKNITYPNGTALIGGELSAGGYSTLIFDGTEWQLIEISPNAFLARGYGNRTVTITSNYSVVAGDGGKNINCNAASLVVTFSSGYLTSNNGPVIVGGYSGYAFTVSAGSGTFVGSSFSGQTSITVVAKGWIAVEPDGTNFRIVAGDPSTLGASGSFAIGGSATVAGTLTVGNNTSVTGTFAAQGATTLSSTLSVTGAVTLNNNLSVTGTTVGTGLATFSNGVNVTGIDNGGNGGQFRAVNANYGVMLRNDSANCFLLQTASGSPYGTWNSYRPFYWNLSNGQVVIDGTGAGTTIGGNVQINGSGTINGSLTVSTNLGVTGTITATSSITSLTNVVSNGTAYFANASFAGAFYAANIAGNPLLNFASGYFLEAIPGAGAMGLVAGGQGFYFYNNGNFVANGLIQGYYGRISVGAYGSGDSNRVVALGDFTLNGSSNGYCRMPNGFIIQWGTNSVGNPSYPYFPIVFPNALTNIVVTEGNAAGRWTQFGPSVHGVTNSGSNTTYYQGYAQAWNGSNGWLTGGITQNFIAVGY